MAQPQDSPMEAVPGTPGIREVRSDHSGSESFGFCTEATLGLPGGNPNPGIRRVGLRAEIDTSPPFGSVKEAVTRFGGSGPWLPYKFGDTYGMEEFDIRKVEEQAAELEKDLIVKELETLDVLEELGTTKRVVEELKRQLQKEALKCLKTPDVVVHSDDHIKEMNTEHYDHLVGSSSPCPASSSPDLILMELKQAKLNLGKTINDLGVIQSSVESLNKKMKKEKILLEKTRERLTCKFAGLATLEDQQEQKPMRPKSRNSTSNHQAEANGNFENSSKFSRQMNPKAGQFRMMVDPTRNELPPSGAMPTPGPEQDKACIRTVEMRWVAARKMEEAARAAEALALAEIKALSNNENLSGFTLPEPEQSPRTPKVRRGADEVSNKKVVHVFQKVNESNFSKLAILKKLEEATEEVRYSKKALEEALNRVEIANKMQLAAEEALRRWLPEKEHIRGVQQQAAGYNASKLSNFEHPERSPLHEASKPNLMNDDSKPVLRPTVSMRDILSRKQVLAEDCVVRRQSEAPMERQKVALSQMLHELREDLTFPAKNDQKEQGDQDHHDHQKPQFYSQRRKFGFIHISLPLAKQSKKKPQPLNC